MAFYNFNCFTVDCSISRKLHSAFYLFSILIFALNPFPVYSQTSECTYSFVYIENQDALRLNLSESLLHKNSLYRVIHFGDSHIQADKLTSEIRNDFQEEGNNGGSGIVFPYSLCGSFGPAGVQSKIVGKYSYATQLKNPSALPIGLMGYTINLPKESKIIMQFDDKFKGKLSKSITIWVHSLLDSTHLLLDANWELTNRKSLGQGIYTYTYETKDIQNQITIKSKSNVAFWGLEFISEKGVSFQQNGLVGAQFTHLIKYEDQVILQLKEIKPDLIIFSYGTNEAYDNIDSNFYFEKVSKFINLLKTNLPNTSILITNAPDTRSGGKSPISQISVNETLKKVSVQCQTAFFDLNKAMGGWGSLYNWQKKGFVLNDQLHFNKEGAKVLGQLITYAIFSSAEIGNSSAREELRESISSSLCSVSEDTLKQKESIIQPIKTDALDLKVKPKKSTKKTKIYVVKKGDNLYKIAQKTGTTINNLKTKNKMSSDEKIYPGQKLKY
jgi:LysM repeat protein/lysophospholipase L1-like esterase